MNEERADEARERIESNFRILKFSLEGLCIREIANRLAQTARCSLSTLYKQDLWHPERSPVTDAISGNLAEIEVLRRIVRSELESPGPPTVTGDGEGNEACNLKSALEKFLSPRGKEGGAGEEKGISPGWLPDMNWAAKEGYAT